MVFKIRLSPLDMITSIRIIKCIRKIGFNNDEKTPETPLITPVIIYSATRFFISALMLLIKSAILIAPASPFP